MTEPKHADWDRADMEEVLAAALAQKEELLVKFPKLKCLQKEIDENISQARTLADKFYSMGVAHARFHGSPDA
ncbi:MAG: hypothetical protein V6Z89_18510 [Desulfobacter sp.]